MGIQLSLELTQTCSSQRNWREHLVIVPLTLTIATSLIIEGEFCKQCNSERDSYNQHLTVIQSGMRDYTIHHTESDVLYLFYIL